MSEPLALPYPPSANRYWRRYGTRIVRSEAATAYRASVAHAGYVAGWRPKDGPVGVLLILRPRLTVRGAASRVRLDLDNCIKVTLDALIGVSYHDDAQVVRLFARIGAPIEGGALLVGVRYLAADYVPR